ncbi:MAG: hypothetical protein J4G17_04855 [Anaerolineae bacterium]|nr:hypothetical protein [Anaerolineae bacterium]
MSLPRKTVEDRFNGQILRVAGVTLLSDRTLSGGDSLASGPFLLRYGLVCLETPQRCIVPELVVMEYGEQLSGEAAWDFLLNHSNLHPRAEVLGRRDDGLEDQLRVSRLDLAQPPRVLVWPWPPDSDSLPLASPLAAVAAAPDTLPDRVRQFLPVYTSTADLRHDLP